MDYSSRSLFVIPVHGTWGRGLWAAASASCDPEGDRWFERGGVFRQRLTEHLTKAGFTPKFRPFLWSGRNSVKERAKAGEALIDHLETLTSEAGEDAIVLVAHSHGGNVAWHAMGEFQRNVPILLVTLATPFVEILPRTQPSRLWERMPRLPAALLVSIFIILIWVQVVGFIFQYIIDPFLFKTDLSNFFGTLIFTTPFIIAITIVITFKTINQLNRPPPEQIFTPRMNAPEHNTGGSKRILVLRGLDDEASLVLAAGAIGTRMVHAVRNLNLLFLHMLIWIVIPVSIISQIIGLTNDAMLSIAIFAASALILSAGLFWIIGELTRTVFGRDMFLRALATDVNSHSAPDTFYETSIRTLFPQTRKMRHQLYDHPEAPQVIASWVCTQVRSWPS